MRLGVSVPVVQRRTRREIEAEAERFLRRFQPECLEHPQPVDLLRMFDRVLPSHYGFRPEISDELPKGIEGLTDGRERTVKLAVRVHEGAEAGQGCDRITIAHEIGHVVLHADATPLGDANQWSAAAELMVWARQTEVAEEENPEWQADVFSLALLMPNEMIARVVRSTAHTEIVPEMVRLFGVDRVHAERRLHELGLCLTAASTEVAHRPAPAQLDEAKDEHESGQSPENASAQRVLTLALALWPADSSANKKASGR
jgi:Zn-dependent peptidase ImmA (M78 family)